MVYKALSIVIFLREKSCSNFAPNLSIPLEKVLKISFCYAQKSPSMIPPDDLIAYNSCQLVARDKCHGVRPFGMGEVMRHTTGRIIVDCIRQDLTSLGGNIQLCLGQKCVTEHAIDSLCHSFDDPENEAFPLFDAKHAFNALNRRTALKNLKILCPFLHFALQNSCSHPSYLYIGKLTILVQESTTQGEPLAMAMYGIAILPLITRPLLDKLTQLGPKYGYLVNLPKCQLKINPRGESQA